MKFKNNNINHCIFLISPLFTDALLLFSVFEKVNLFHTVLYLKNIYGIIFFLISSYLAFKWKDSEATLFWRYRLKIAYGTIAPIVLGFGPLLTFLENYVGLHADKFLNTFISLLLATSLFYLLIGLYTLKDLILQKKVST